MSFLLSKGLMPVSSLFLWGMLLLHLLLLLFMSLLLLLLLLLVVLFLSVMLAAATDVSIAAVIDFYGGQSIGPHERGTDADAASSRHVPFSRRGEKQTRSDKKTSADTYLSADAEKNKQGATKRRLAMDTRAAHCRVPKVVNNKKHDTVSITGE